MLELIPRGEPSRRMACLSPILALVLTALCGVFMFLIMGKSPLQGLNVFFVQPLTSVQGWAEIGVKVAPLLLCAVGLALCFRANIFNIGAEGQLVMGAIASGAFILQFDDGMGGGGPFMIALAVLAGALGGACWAAVVAWLRDRYHTNEILVSLMLVYVAELLLSYLVHGVMRDPDGFGFPQSRLFDDSFLLPVLSGTRLHLGIILALLAAGFAWLLLSRLFAGYRLTVGGLAPMAARYAGFSSRQALWGCLLGSGALAGVAGAVEIMGPIGQLTPSVSPGYGFTAIIVAFVGRLHPLGVVFASFIMALFYIGGELSQTRLGMPSAITGIFQGILLFSLLACDVLIHQRLHWRR